MTTDPFTEAAADAAVNLWTPIHTTTDPLSMPERRHRRIGFTMGAEWARAHLAAQEPTDAEVEALARMTTEEVSGCDWASFGEDARDYHRDTARRRLTAARAARRDEKDKP